MNQIAKGLVAAAKKLRSELDLLSFRSPVAFVYNPIRYAWRAHEKYLVQYSAAPCRTLFLGMNPGPWGMAQTGVPFGEIDAVREYLQIETQIDRPEIEHPKRPIQGFDCSR
ncbi:MAG: single-stranded DNA-binding protein, partial [Pirellula sp.]